MTKKVKASPPIAPPEDPTIFQESPAFSAGAQPQADMPVCWFRQLGLRNALNRVPPWSGHHPRCASIRLW